MFPLALYPYWDPPKYVFDPHKFTSSETIVQRFEVKASWQFKKKKIVQSIINIPVCRIHSFTLVLQMCQEGKIHNCNHKWWIQRSFLLVSFYFVLQKIGNAVHNCNSADCDPVMHLLKHNHIAGTLYNYYMAEHSGLPNSFCRVLAKLT